MNSKLKLILLLSEAYLLELNEFEERDKVYHKEFLEDFYREQAFIGTHNKKSPIESVDHCSAREKKLVEKKENKELGVTLKGVYKQLALITHPDVADTGDAKNFHRVQKAYEEMNVSVLIEEAMKHNIQLNLSEKEFDNFRLILKRKNQELEERKTSVRWVWCTSKKEKFLRKQIWESLGIDKKKYKAWLSDQD